MASYGLPEGQAMRNLESYLLADDVIEALVLREGKDHLLADANKVKTDAIAKSVARGNPGDDLKSAAGEIYVGLKQVLGLQMNHASGGDVTLGHYVGKSEAQLRAG